MIANFQFWLGLALAVPLSIAENLLTPWLQERFLRHLGARSNKKKEMRRKQQERISRYADDRSELYVYLLLTIVIATMIGSLVAAFASLLYMLGIFGTKSLAEVLAQGLTVFGALMVVKICLDAANTTIAVRTLVEQRRADRDRPGASASGVE